MDSELEAMLRKAGCEGDVVAHIRDVRMCKTVAVLAGFPSIVAESLARATDVATKLVRDSEWKEDEVTIAMLSMVYRKAVASADRLLKKSCEGVPENDLKTPLPEEQHKEMMQTHLRTYSLTRVCSQRIASDSLMGKVRKEFEQARPTNIAIDRVKTLA